MTYRVVAYGPRGYSDPPAYVEEFGDEQAARERAQELMADDTGVFYEVETDGTDR